MYYVAKFRKGDVKHLPDKMYSTSGSLFESWRAEGQEEIKGSEERPWEKEG
jgi:hypothetical protein